MTKTQTVIKLIKSTEIFSDIEKSFWLEILPSFDEIQQDEFHKILLQGSEEYKNIKLKQTKVSINVKKDQKQEWKDMVSKETAKTNKFVKEKIKELDEEKIKSILKQLE